MHLEKESPETQDSIQRTDTYNDTPSQPQSERSKRRRQWVGLRQTVGGVEFPWCHAKGRPFAFILMKTGDMMKNNFEMNHTHLIDRRVGIPAPSLMCRIRLWLHGAFCR